MSGRRHAIGGALLLGVMLGWPALARAQAVAGIETKPLATWRFEVSSDGTWYENAYFLGNQVPEDTAWSVNTRARLTRERRFKTGSFSLSAYGGGIYYPEIDGFNQPTYGGMFQLNWRPGRRSTLMLQQSYDRTNTRFLNAVDSAGLPLPTSPTTYATSGFSFEHKLSQYWAFGMDGRFEIRDYDEPALVGSDQVYANASLGRQVGPRSQLYIGYGLTASWYDQVSTRSHQVLIGVLHKPATHGIGTGFELAGGAGYVESTGKSYPSGRAGLTFASRTASLALLYNRDFGQAYGYGRQTIGDEASATLRWGPSRSLSLDVDYHFSYRRDPADPSYTINSGIASGGFSWLIGGGVAFGTRYAWERNVTEGFSEAGGSRVTFSLSYGVDFK